MSDGARAGALVLFAITVVVVVPLMVFGLRIWYGERQAGDSE